MDRDFSVSRLLLLLLLLLLNLLLNCCQEESRRVGDLDSRSKSSKSRKHASFPSPKARFGFVFIIGHSNLSLQCTDTVGWVTAPSGPRVVRIDPLHFLAGCRTRLLNQVYFLFYILACFNCFNCIVAY